MVRKNSPSPSKQLTTNEALALAKRPEVEDVRRNRHGWWIIFTTEFQDEVALRYLQGEKPVSIFRSHNLGPEFLGYKRIERCVYRWASHPSNRRMKRLSGEHQGYKNLIQNHTDNKETSDK